jgi:hypothetical protein
MAGVEISAGPILYSADQREASSEGLDSPIQFLTRHISLLPSPSHL